jgi:catechol 2,3-dioxygenase-like lactoylglutathione lyase family enzyme
MANETLEYGNFSVSLAVKDIQKSYEFYRNLGFREVAGDLTKKWIVLANDSGRIGLMEGMFEKNILTFNPKDVRMVHRALRATGIQFDKEPEGAEGPGYATLKDPDGNDILLDQHY